MDLQIRLTGTKPIMFHNERLANPLDPIVQELKKYTSKRKKTTEDFAHIAQLEMQGGVYRTRENLLGVPTRNVFKTINEGAKANRKGRDIERGLVFAETIEPVEVDGAKVDADDFIAREEAMDYRSVVIQGKRTMRARPIIEGDWATTHYFDMAEDILDLEVVELALARAGKYVGLCEYRPRYGTFEAEVEVLS